MKTFKEFIVEDIMNQEIIHFIDAILSEDEMNNEDLAEGSANQQKINKHLAAGKTVGIVSHEGPHTDTPQKKAEAEKHLRAHLNAAKKAGHIGGWSGPHKGQYKYDKGPKDIAKEGSYVVHSAGKTKEHHARMEKALKHIGNTHNQESVLTVHPSSKATYHYLNRSAKPGTKKHIGIVSHNQELTTGSGNTEFKKGHSITTKKVPYEVRGGKKIVRAKHLQKQYRKAAQ